MLEYALLATLFVAVVLLYRQVLVARALGKRLAEAQAKHKELEEKEAATNRALGSLQERHNEGATINARLKQSRDDALQEMRAAFAVRDQAIEERIRGDFYYERVRKERDEYMQAAERIEQERKAAILDYAKQSEQSQRAIVDLCRDYDAVMALLQDCRRTNPHYYSPDEETEIELSNKRLLAAFADLGKQFNLSFARSINRSYERANTPPDLLPKEEAKESEAAVEQAD